jgi:HK97 family phage major capsid protein
LPVLDSTTLEPGEFLIGAFDVAAQLWDREDANVEISTEDQDNFIKNLVTIRAEERLALTVYREESFIYGDFDTTVSS